jgi:hypothetical protein
MPEGVEPIDPLFLDAVFKEFTPEEREAFWEKIGAVREGK